jgi:ATP-dependent DNA ligase
VPRFGAQLAGDNGLGPLQRAIAEPKKYLVEEKWDGFRGLVTFEDGKIAIRNRHGEDKGRMANAPLVEAALRALADSEPGFWDGTVLDGELVGPSWAETAHLLSGRGRSETGLRFVVFDLPYFAGDDLRGRQLYERRLVLELTLAKVQAPVELSQGLDPAADLAASIWARGGEGLIIKDFASLYMAGNRSAWSKIKKAQTTEAVVMGFQEGKGKYVGMVGAIILGQYRDGQLVEIARTSGMTDVERASLSAADINRVLEVEFQDRTADSLRHPRFLRFRDDKDPADCTWD